MKFIISKNVIFKSLSHLQNIVEKKNPLPILSSILIEAKDNNLILSSTDMDISITEKINCNVLENGATTINAHTIYDIIRKLQDDSEIEIICNDGKLLTLRSGTSRFSLNCLPKEDFPIIETENSGKTIKINSQELLKLIDKTKFAISTEETRYFLNGLYLNVNSENNKRITIVGTDGHRLAKFEHVKEDLNEQIQGVIIPKKTINELSKLLSENTEEIELNINTSKIVFFIQNLVLISKLIDGSFPDYNKVIPNNNNNIMTVKRVELASAVDRVSTIANEKTPVVKLKLMKNLININTVNSENNSASEDIEVKYEGETIEIGFNSKYILELINNLEDDEISIAYKDNSSPIMATEKSNPDLVYVLMPMRV